MVGGFGFDRQLLRAITYVGMLGDPISVSQKAPSPLDSVLQFSSSSFFISLSERPRFLDVHPRVHGPDLRAPFGSKPVASFPFVWLSGCFPLVT